MNTSSRHKNSHASAACVARPGAGTRGLAVFGVLMVSSMMWSCPASASKLPSGINVQAVSCANSRICNATAIAYKRGIHGYLLHSTDSGRSWTAHALPKDLSVSWGGLACPSAVSCLVGGESPYIGGVLTTNAGVTWSTMFGDANYQGANVSCATRSNCIAASNSVTSGPLVHSVDGGHAWITVRTPRGFYPFLTACPTTRYCYAASAHTLAASNDGGEKWQFRRIPGFDMTRFYAMTCSEVGRCFLAGIAYGDGTQPSVVSTSDGGRHWRMDATPAASSRNGNPNAQVNAIACWSASDCMAVGYDLNLGRAIVDVTLDGGAIWRASAAPAGAFELNGVSCPASRLCYVGGTATRQKGAFFSRTANGGASWHI